MIGCVGIAVDARFTHPACQIPGHENEIAGKRFGPLLAVEYAQGGSVRCARMHDLPAVHVARRAVGGQNRGPFSLLSLKS